MRPCGPDPAIALGSTPSPCASLRTRGVALTRSPCKSLLPGSARETAGAAGAGAGAAPSPSITTSRVPTGTTSPSPTKIRETTPAAGEGISTVVLSVAISTSGSSSAISWPSATSQRAISPSVRPSPRSGSLNSYGIGRNLAGRSDPGVRGDDQHPEAAFDAPERHGLLVPGELRRRLARHIAGLERSLLVPDRDRIWIAFVVGLAHEGQAPAGVERRVVDVPGAERHAGDRDDAEPRILPPDGLARGGVAEPVARAPALEPEAKAFAHDVTLRALHRCGSSTED